MTYFALYTFWCDHDGCIEYIQPCFGCTEREDYAFAVARRNGWAGCPRISYCPRHATEADARRAEIDALGAVW